MLSPQFECFSDSGDNRVKGHSSNISCSVSGDNILHTGSILELRLISCLLKVGSEVGAISHRKQLLKLL